LLRDPSMEGVPRDPQSILHQDARDLARLNHFVSLSSAEANQFRNLIDAEKQRFKRAAMVAHVPPVGCSEILIEGVPLKLLVDPNVSAANRLRAAELVLRQGTKVIEMADLAARVRALEQAADSAKSSARPSTIVTVSTPKALPSPETVGGGDHSE